MRNSRGWQGASSCVHTLLCKPCQHTKDHQGPKKPGEKASIQCPKSPFVALV